MEIDKKIEEIKRDTLNDFTPKCYEWIMKEPFNLEHAEHGKACLKFQDIRNSFLNG